MPALTIDITRPLATAAEFGKHLKLRDPRAIRRELEAAKKLGAAVQMGRGRRRTWRVNIPLYWHALGAK